MRRKQQLQAMATLLAANLSAQRYEKYAFFNYYAALIAAVYVESNAIAYQQFTYVYMYISISNSPTTYTQCCSIDFIIRTWNACFETLKHALRRNAHRLATAEVKAMH